jgi:peptide/nickel transport system ATP-binding protein
MESLEQPDGLQPDRPVHEQSDGIAPDRSAAEPPLDVRDLSVSFATRDGEVRAVEGVSFALARGEVLAIVGESGSGKSVCAMTLMGLTRAPNTTIAGSALLEGRELIGASEGELRRTRGARLAMVFQDPQSSLNPVHRVGDQIAEQIRAHEPLVSKAKALDRAGGLMERVGIQRARERVRSYPHELSGGMRQRVMIAMALSLGAKVLLADEPTTALDVTVQAQILAQLKELREQEQLSILLITHDFGVVADIADRIAVMQAGRIVEQGVAAQIFEDPEHPYTQGLLQALIPPPRRRPPSADGGARPASLTTVEPSAPASGSSLGGPPPPLSPTSQERRPPPASSQVSHDEEPLLVVDRLKVRYRGRGRRDAAVDALDGVSLTLAAGETLAIVGESGCGKTTLLRSIAGLIEPTGGAVRLHGQDLVRVSRRGPTVPRLGMVFQDPQASLNPRRRIGGTLERALHARGLRSAEGRAEVGRLLDRVGLKPAYAARYPHELSGGERQRVGIARALAGEPPLVLLDEPVSSLDASIRRGVIELLSELQAQLGCSYVLVSHDFTTVEAVADRIAVMHGGKIVELGEASALLEQPTHPYTRELIAACPRLPGGVRSSGWAQNQTSLAHQEPSAPERSPRTQQSSSSA